MNSIILFYEAIDELIPIAYQDIIDQALSDAMNRHKQEIIDAWKDGEGHNDDDSQDEAEWYYSQKFKL
jgi:hypothetical protein